MVKLDLGGEMSTCFNYHVKTAHTYQSVRRPHYLDWSNYPSPYKFYPDARRFKLPPFKAFTGETLDTLYRICADRVADTLDLQDIANLCFAMNGITKVENFHGEPFGFRATPSAGALYPFELYLFIEKVDGLPDGVYHYQSGNHSLELLLEGNYRQAFESALCAYIPGNVVAVITSIYARSAWKYRARAYRYCLLDAGHMAANGALYLRSVGVEGTVVSLFKDNLLNSLLGIDGENEFALCAVFLEKPPLNWGEDFVITADFPKAAPVVEKPIYEPEIVNVHLDGNLDTCRFYRPFPTAADDIPQVDSLSLGDVLLKRRSRREFTGRVMAFDDFKFILESSLLCFPADWGFPKLNFYVQLRGVEGLRDGVYAVKDGALVLFKEGDFGREVAALCLSQRFVALANFNLIFTVDFEKVLNCRQYRGALLEGGALGENLYLASESLNHGACGIGAFYDFDLQAFLGLKRTELPAYVVSVGLLS